MLSILYLLLGLGLSIGAVLGWIAFFKVRALRARIDQLEARLADQDNSPKVHVSSPPNRDAASTTAPPPRQQPATPQTQPAQANLPQEPGRLTRALRHLLQNWMLWLGGLSITLAGVFLVRYAIEQGVFGPTARVLLGLATGLALHAGAEWLRRHSRFQSDAVAALAGSASLVLYAAVLAALHLYQLWPPLVAFALLVLISLASMALALRHGPVLAIGHLEKPANLNEFAS